MPDEQPVSLKREIAETPPEQITTPVSQAGVATDHNAIRPSPGTFHADTNSPHSGENTPPADPNTIPIIEEKAIIEKKVVETGKVHISKVVYEDVDRYAIPTTEEHVTVERIPRNVLVDVVPPPVRYEGDVMIIPVLKEVAVVEKRMMLVEELRVTKTKTEKTETHEITLRKEEVKVNRKKTNPPS